MQKIYLASPYTHPDPVVRDTRVELASIVAARLMEAGYVVFSPITHGHSVADHLHHRDASSHEFWMRQCLPMLASCDWMMVLPIDGWRESRGLAEERQFAIDNSIPTFIWQHTCSDFELLGDEEITTCNLSIFQGQL